MIRNKKYSVFLSMPYSNCLLCAFDHLFIILLALQECMSNGRNGDVSLKS